MVTILIWDDDSVAAPEGDWTTVLWCTFPTGAAHEISIPQVVEEHAGELRARFLAWVYELGETRVAAKSVVDHLELRPGFSYWWMTLLSHTPNYYEAAFVTDVIKCLAFEGLGLVSAGPRLVRLHTRNPMLRALMQQYCRVRGLEFQTHPSPAMASPSARPSGFRQTLARLFSWISAAAGSARGNGEPRASGMRSAICVFDMLVHLRKEALEQGTFQSQYWTTLNAVLAAGRTPTTWVHTFFRHPDVPSVQDARRLVERFNASGPPTERHLLVDRLTVPIFLSAARSYGRLCAAALRLRGIRTAFTPEGSRFDFWPLFRRTWRASLTGRSAVRNCLTLAMYERLLSALPHQATGVYIKENQPWEMALLHAWRSAGHGRIIGAPHSTVRFWDLRYFYDPRSYGQHGTHAVPTPDSVAVNGPAARAAYVAGGYPASQLVDVEALRFLHVAAAGSSRSEVVPRSELRVLICGDNTPESNARMLGIVQDAARCLQRKTHFTFKPHKAAPLQSALPGSLHFEVRDGDLAQMLRECDIVLTGSLTSAAVDAYCLGKPVASLLDGRSLNGSPLRGLPGVGQFASARELVAILASAGADAARLASVAAEPYFWLDLALPRWRALLEPRAA